MNVNLTSEKGTITARRIKADDCSLNANGVEILSSLEAARLKVEAGELGLIVKKRLGVGEFAKIESKGPIKIGSVFSNMASLPEVTGCSETTIESFKSAIKAAAESTSGQTIIVSGGDVTIDNLQGVVTIVSDKTGSINLHTIESAKLVVDTPAVNLKMNLRSIHDVSHINCAKAEIVVTENFNKSRVFDHKAQCFAQIGEAVPENAPILHVLATEGLKLTVMGEFEMLRRRIMEGMAARKKQQ